MDFGRKSVMTAVFTLGISALSGTAANAKTTVRFWHNWSGAGGRVIANMADNFNKSQNRIIVKVAQNSDTYQKLLVATAAGHPPDVVVLDRYLTANYASKKVLFRLDALVKRDGGIQSGSFYKSTWEEVLYRGGIYGIPMTADSRTLWYNKSLFEKAGLDPRKPPKTWAETRLYSEKLTQRDSAGRLEKVGYVPTWEQGGVKIQYLWENGGDVFNDDETKVIFNSAAAVEAYKWVVDMMDYYGPALNKFGSAGAMKAMYAGKLAMVMNGPSMQSDVIKNAPKSFQENVRYGPVPYFKKPGVLCGGMGLIIPANSKKRNEAWEFIKYLTSKEQQIYFGLNNCTIPALRAAANSPEYRNDEFRIAHVVEMDVTRHRPTNPAYPDIEPFLNGAVDVAISHKKSVEQALNDNLPPAQKILDTFNLRAKRHYQ